MSRILNFSFVVTSLLHSFASLFFSCTTSNSRVPSSSFTLFPFVFSSTRAKYAAWAARVGVIPREQILALYAERGGGADPVTGK